MALLGLSLCHCRFYVSFSTFFFFSSFSFSIYCYEANETQFLTKLLQIPHAHKCRSIVLHVHLKGTLYRRYRTHRVVAKTQRNTRLDRGQPTRRGLFRLEPCLCKAIIIFVKAMEQMLPSYWWAGLERANGKRGEGVSSIA